MWEIRSVAEGQDDIETFQLGNFQRKLFHSGKVHQSLQRKNGREGLL